MPSQDLLDIGAEREPEGRKDHDFYETPAFQTRALMARVPIRGYVLEPCAGRGAISRVFVKERPYGSGPVIVNEPYQEHHWTLDDTTWSSVYGEDATQPGPWMCSWPMVDWVVTNPPFNLAHLIIPLAFQHAQVGIAFLLRITWYEAAENRQEFLEAHPPDAIISLPRYKYRKDKEHGDSATTAWFVWLKPGAGITVRNSAVTRAECKRLGAA